VLGVNVGPWLNFLSVCRCVCVFVRPLLELVQLFGTPCLRNNNKLESVQRRFTKRSQGLLNFSYKARLTHVGLDSLHCRRTKADLLNMCYKIINNYTCTQVDSFFTFFSTNQTKVIPENLINNISHLLAIVIGFPSVLLMCDHVVLSKTVITFKYKTNKLHFSDYCCNWLLHHSHYLYYALYVGLSKHVTVLLWAVELLNVSF